MPRHPTPTLHVEHDLLNPLFHIHIEGSKGLGTHHTICIEPMAFLKPNYGGLELLVKEISKIGFPKVSSRLQTLAQSHDSGTVPVQF